MRACFSVLFKVVKTAVIGLRALRCHACKKCAYVNECRTLCIFAALAEYIHQTAAHPELKDFKPCCFEAKEE